MVKILHHLIRTIPPHFSGLGYTRSCRISIINSTLLYHTILHYTIMAQYIKIESIGSIGFSISSGSALVGPLKLRAGNPAGAGAPPEI